MARPKQFDQRVIVRFDDASLSAMQAHLADNEDRSDFIRSAVDLAVAIRGQGIWGDIQANITANETVEAFCAQAVRRALKQRKAALSNDDAHDTEIAD